MATIGPKELQRRTMREQRPARASAAKPRAVAPEFCTYPRCKCIVSTSTSRPEPECPHGRPLGPPAEQKAEAKPAPRTKESDVRAKTTKKAPPRSAAKGKTAPAKIDRSPLAVGNFIAAGGLAGVTMGDLAKEFGIEAHPMRSKIFSARHELKFKIRFDAKTSRYVGSSPKQKQKAAA